MKVIATVTGPLKKYVGKDFHFKFIFRFKTLLFSGKEVLVSQMRGGEDCPIKPQVKIHICFVTFTVTLFVFCFRSGASVRMTA